MTTSGRGYRNTGAVREVRRQRAARRKGPPYIVLLQNRIPLLPERHRRHRVRCGHEHRAQAEQVAFSIRTTYHLSDTQLKGIGRQGRPKIVKGQDRRNVGWHYRRVEPSST